MSNLMGKDKGENADNEMGVGRSFHLNFFFVFLQQ